MARRGKMAGLRRCLPQLALAALWCCTAAPNDAAAQSLHCPARPWRGVPAKAPPFTLPVLAAHPRLHLTPPVLARIRDALATDATMRATWTTQFLPELAQVQATDPARAYAFRPRTACTDDQGWMRGAGDSLAVLAFGFAVTRDRLYLDGGPGRAGLVQYLRVILGETTPWHPGQGYASWGNNDDLAAATLLQGMALAYDWVRDQLPAAMTAAMHDALIYHGTLMYQAASGQYDPVTMGDTPSWYAGDFLQGHLLVNVAGLLAAALALADPTRPDDAARVEPWVSLARADLATSLAYMGPRQGYQPDGASQEGASYAGYALQALLRAMDLTDTLLGTHFEHPAQPAAEWLQLVPAYDIYLSLPADAWVPALGHAPGNTAMSLGDNFSLFSRGPDYLMRKLATTYLAGPYAPYARAFADLFLARGVNGADYLTWLNFVWSDSGGPTLPLQALPALHWFPNFGFVSTRSDWSGDESLLFFISGPPIGFTNADNADIFASVSHVHPYQNSFYVFGAGQYIFPNVGYETPKFTQNENTLRVNGTAAPGVDTHGTPVANGVGQLGEGGTWFRGNPAVALIKSTMRVVQNNAVFDYMIGDATTAYPAAAGIALFQRGLIYLKQADAVIVLDTIRMKDGLTARSLDLDFHPATALVHAVGDGAIFVTRDMGANANIRVQSFDPLARIALYDNPYVPENGRRPYPTFPTLTIERTDLSIWQNGVAMSWSGAGQSPAVVSGRHTAGSWVFTLTRNGFTVGRLAVNANTVSPSAHWYAG